jgi:hypothetical protein
VRKIHKGYKVSSKIHRKLGTQRTGRFKILKVLGHGNAYKLDIPKHWKVHPVISMEHVEPVPDGDDPYERPTPEVIEPIPTEGDTEEWKSWEIEKLVDKRTRKFGRGRPQTEYLVRWKGYGPAYDEWYPTNLLENAKQLIAQYEDSRRESGK